MSTIQTLLTDHIDIWTAADTAKKSGRGRSSNNAASVYGIKKLRELILELAVRGKLVPQDANDEPASELLKRIQAEKAKLVAEGKIKRKSPLTPLLQRGGSTPTAATSNSPPLVKGGAGGISVEEQPFELPQGWEWARLGFIGYTQTGATPSKSSSESFGSDIPFVKPGDIYSNHVEYSNEGLSFYGAEQSGRIAPSGSILMVCIGTIGKCNLIDRNCSFNQQINSVTPYLFDSLYLLSVCRSVYFYTEAWSRSSSTTIAILNKGNWEEICIPIPPIEEQHRIVAKVDELMALCDQLETQHSNAAEAHEKLVSHLLGTLTQSQSAEDFSANWQRIAAHFDTLFTTETSIDALKQTLLQLAVMGKLVPQDPNDEPASELLKRIQAEKAKLIAEGKIKKDKPLAQITEEEKSFESPKGWEWVRLKDIIYILGDGLHGTPKYTSNTGCYFVNGNNLQNGKIIIKHETKTVSLEEMERYKKNLNERTVLVSINGTIGNIAFYNDENIILGKSACYFNLANLIYKYYLKVLIDSPYFISYAIKSVSETTIMNLSLFSMNNFPLLIPPIEEQHRIVAKVDELMAICDQLKSRITEANQLQQKLADVVVERAIS